MNIDDYRYIITIADTGSLTSAANKLFVAQPSLSQRVKLIERLYGITIFNRAPKGVRLTEEGECFVRYARKILACEEDLRNEILDMHDLKQSSIRVGIPQFIYSPFFNKMLSHIHEKDANLQFDIIEDSSLHLQQQLLENELDIAICYLPVESPNLAYELIYEDDFVLVPAKGGSLEEKIGNASIAPGSYIDPKFLDQEAFAVGMPGTRSYKFLNAVIEEHKINIKILHKCKNFSALHKIAQSGVASVFLNESLFDKDTEPKPYYYLEDTSYSSLSVVVVWRKNTYLRKTAKELIQFIREIS